MSMHPKFSTLTWPKINIFEWNQRYLIFTILRWIPAHQGFDGAMNVQMNWLNKEPATTIIQLPLTFLFIGLLGMWHFVRGPTKLLTLNGEGSLHLTTKYFKNVPSLPGRRENHQPIYWTLFEVVSSAKYTVPVLLSEHIWGSRKLLDLCYTSIHQRYWPLGDWTP